MAEVKTITIDVQTAKYLYDLYQNCQVADALLKSCQNNLFRNQIQGCYKAANVKAAFDILKRLIDIGGDQG